MMSLLAIAVLLMAQVPEVDTMRGPVKTQSMSYAEHAPAEHDLDLTATREGTVRIQFKKIKPNCPDRSKKTCWTSYDQSKLLAPEQIDKLFKPVDGGRWRYFYTQINSAPGSGHFTLKVVSNKGTTRKEGNIYDAMANDSISKIRNEALNLAEQWLPRHDTADKKN